MMKLNVKMMKFQLPLPRQPRLRQLRAKGSAKHVASRALVNSYEDFKTALSKLAESDPDEKTNKMNIVEAESLLNQLGRFDMAFIAVLWDVILERIDAVNKYVPRGRDIDLGSAVQLYASLVDFFQEMRDNRLRIFEIATKLSGQSAEKAEAEFAEKRPSKRKFHHEETIFNLTSSVNYRTSVFM